MTVGRSNLPGGDFLSNLYTNIGTPTGQWIETQRPAADGVNVLFTRAVFDGLGRTWRNVAKGTATAAILVNRGFDARGRVASETAPFYNGVDAAQTTTFAYDALDRETERRHPDAATVKVIKGTFLIFAAASSPEDRPRKLGMSPLCPLRTVSSLQAAAAALISLAGLAAEATP